MRVSVVIPSYRRPEALARCVRSIAAGASRPDEIVIVCREDDQETLEAVPGLVRGGQDLVKFRVGTVREAGHIPPIEKGAALAEGEIVAVVDDDTTVDERWLEHLLPHFRDATVGVVGGRVVTLGVHPTRLRGKPGCVAWYGRYWANVATMNAPSPIQVDGVMECNWAWRRELLCALGFDRVLNFDDGSLYGLDLCLRAKRKGFRVLYEPRARVHHYIAPRAPELDRRDRAARGYTYSRNLAYIMLKHLPTWRRAAFVGWWFLIGERGSPGLAAFFVDACKQRRTNWGSVKRCWAGKIEGCRAWRESQKRGSAHPTTADHRTKECGHEGTRAVGE